MRIAVVGATGLVGSKMLQVLDEQKVKMDELMVAASERSVGKAIAFQGKTYHVISVEDAIKARPDIAIFSAGASASKQYAPLFAAKGTYVIDNSSAWRMFPEIPLVVPEINADTITKDTHIIANPNCSTIQMVMALAPIHKAYGLKRLVISTYQSVTGSGVKGAYQLHREEDARHAAYSPMPGAGASPSGVYQFPPAYPHQIYYNVIPQAGDFVDNGYTTEEEKLVNETRKILRDDHIAITATATRVPVTGGHSEAVNVETERPFEIDDVRKLMEAMPGVVVQDNPSQNLYPMAITSFDKDEVFVGRIRRDFSIENGLNFWVVSDNIRKGAATNAVQIAQYVIEHIL
ncbi:MAG: aspartate-semialdehyde dehydrogenase [Bacteroidales bacterium]|nr:aspartate-semialdehyde dehydrogenase [Bacteroidales bacterium]